MTRKLLALAIVLATAVAFYAQGDKSVKVNGYLIDNMCAGAHKKDKDFAEWVKKHKTSCALMPNCSGSGFGLVSEDGKFYKFDEAGSKSAHSLMESTEAQSGVLVEAEGTLEGDTLHVTKLSEVKPSKA